MPPLSFEKTLAGHPDFQHLVDELHPTKNTIDPKTVSAKSPKDAWWICKEHGEKHTWKAKVSSRTTNKGQCPICSGKKVLAGFNDITTTHPQIARQWHPTLNKENKPQQFTANSNKDAHWLGECGHEWKARIQSRTIAGNKCPYCSNRKLLTGFNDLASYAQYAHLVQQWHPDNDLQPTDVMAGSNKSALWKCDAGHEWKAIIANRTRKGSGCRECSYSTRRVGNPIASEKLHSEWSPANDKALEEYTAGSMQSGEWICSLDPRHIWTASIANRVQGSGCPVCSGDKVITGVNDLATTHPNYAAQWHPDNEKKATEVFAGMDRSALWKCDAGHEWKAKVYTRIKHNYGCRECLGRRKTHSLTDYPELVSQWHPDNEGTPADYTAGSGLIVKWKCPVDSRHVWESTISARTSRPGVKCPACHGRQIIEGVNDLATLRPNLIKEWDETNAKKPTEISVSSEYRAIWKCSRNEDHPRWAAVVYSRSRKDAAGCPRCSLSKIGSQGEDEIAAFLDSLGVEYERNTQGLMGNRQHVDFYIPTKNFAIEFNGVYWHSEAVRPDRHYHYNKWKACADNGVQLIQVWEDDWMSKQEVVRQMLAYKLGLAHKLDGFNKIGARETSVKQISFEQAASFLDSHHVQGQASGSMYLGLVEKEKKKSLRAVLVIHKQGQGEWLISRYASAGSVSGGFTKLLKAAQQKLPVTKWITFADLSISDGGLYKTNGFKVDKVLPPDYTYLVNGERKHKFGFRLKRFRDDPNLLYKEGLSESQLAELNGIPRIWDTGKVRYTKEVLQVSALRM